MADEQKEEVGRIEIWKGKSVKNTGSGRGWYWKAVAPNGQTVAEGGESYRDRVHCIRGACRFGPAGWPVRAEDYRRGIGAKSGEPRHHDIPRGDGAEPWDTRPGYIDVWKAKDGFRWRARVASNGKSVAESGEAYERKGTAIMSALKYGPAGFTLVDQTDNVSWRPQPVKSRPYAR
jgi:uncharacterized protein YegP (UPF0339 family)